MKKDFSSADKSCKLTPADKESIIKILSLQEDISAEDIKETSSFADLQMDSLDVIGFVMDVERHFSVCIPYKQRKDLKTIGDVYQAVSAALSGK